MSEYAFSAGKVTVYEAWTMAEVRVAVQMILEQHGRALPEKRDARIVIKPNLNNDLSALTGNSTDLRLLAALMLELKALGYINITVADGPNVGVERRGIDVFKRLRIDRLTTLHNVQLVNLNRDSGSPIELEGGATPRVATTLTEADFIICAPTVKTHAEAGMSIACKNWVGIVCGQDKRQMHFALGPNIARLVQRFPPHLVIVDGLVGMEGNGPGDGEPKRLGFIAASENPWLCDLAVSRLVGFDWQRISYLHYAWENEIFHRDLPMEVTSKIAPITKIEPAPERNILAETSDKRSLFWLKKLMRPITGRKRVAELAYRAGIIQDVYDLNDDTVTGVRRVNAESAPRRACEEVCPTELPLESIGLENSPELCINCLYCWWRCDSDALQLDGEPQFMTRQITRYKKRVETL